MRPLFERIDEMRDDARVAFVNLVLLRIVVVQRAQRLRLHTGYHSVITDYRFKPHEFGFKVPLGP